MEKFFVDAIEKDENFTRFFIEGRDYLIYYNTSVDHGEKKVLIGRNVMYLNYVSFSFDSRFLAFGAKMNEDDLRCSKEGVFCIYDLVNDCEIKRMGAEDQLWAVWMALFSKTGDAAFYDSKSNAYLIKGEDAFNTTIQYRDKSLLCFSPSGKFIALSDQNYVAYSTHDSTVETCGHQPSGNVYIYKSGESNNCITHFNDLAEGISGISTKANSIASAAFSSDEKRFLVVGNDGVIVIRNLYLNQ